MKRLFGLIIVICLVFFLSNKAFNTINESSSQKLEAQLKEEKDKAKTEIETLKSQVSRKSAQLEHAKETLLKQFPDKQELIVLAFELNPTADQVQKAADIKTNPAPAPSQPPQVPATK